MPQTQIQHGKSNKITLPQHSTTSRCKQVKSISFGRLFRVKMRQARLAGRLKFYSENWEKLTQDVNILSIVQGFKIPFSQTPFYYGPPQLGKVNQEERLQINSEIKGMLWKGAIQQVKSDPGEFLSNLFLESKNDGGHRSVINLKLLNSFIPYQHFKMEGIHLIKEILQEHDFLIKIDLKNAYFGIPLNKKSKNIFVFNGKEIYTNSFAYVLAWVQSVLSSEGPNCLIKEDQCRHDNIFGRHTCNGQNVERHFPSKGEIDLSVIKFRFCEKYKKVATNTSEGNRVFGVSGEFSKHDISLTPGKSFRYPKQMHVTFSVNKDHNYGINQTPRKSLVHCSDSASRENSVQVLATATNSGKFLSNKNKMKPTITGRVEVVEGEFTSSEQQIAENRNSTIHHSNGCFRNRLRGNLSGNHHGGNLFISAKDKTYQCTGAHCSETCKFNLCQGKIGNNNPFTN